jgi:hypothetical protein
MNEPFQLELTYEGMPYELAAAFQRYGYTYRIVVTIDEHNYVFEPDEDGQYRALGAPEGAKPDVGLLRAVAEKLQKL